MHAIVKCLQNTFSLIIPRASENHAVYTTCLGAKQQW